MKQLEYYPNRDKFRLWDETGEMWFNEFFGISNYLKANDIWRVRTKTMHYTEKKLLEKAGIKVYATND